MGKIPPGRLTEAALSGRRSPLFIYMLARHAEIAEELAGIDRPNWEALAAEFNAAGLKDINGDPVTRSVARNTWVRVRKLVEKRGG